MKKTIDIRERIAVRAYFAWLAGSTAGDAADWLAAEAIEIAYAESRAVKRTASNAGKSGNDLLLAERRAATPTRRAKTKAPAEMLVAAKDRPTIRLTAH